MSYITDLRLRPTFSNVSIYLFNFSQISSLSRRFLIVAIIKYSWAAVHVRYGLRASAAAPAASRARVGGGGRGEGGEHGRQ